MPPANPKLLPTHIPIEEELNPEYRPSHFFPANPGDVLGSRYVLRAKLGFGTSSTVWLAQDDRARPGANPFVALKICTSSPDATQHELEISKHIISCAKGDTTRYDPLLVAHDNFTVQGPDASHLCLVMDPMREPLWMTRRRICGVDKVTAEMIPIFKCYIHSMLAGLEYLHQDCKIVHTGKS